MKIQQQTLCQPLVGRCLNITLPFKALPADFMDGLSGNAMKFNHWIIVVTPPLGLLHSCEPYVKASKVWRQTGTSSACFECTWIKGQWEENKMKCTWTTGTEQTKKKTKCKICVMKCVSMKSPMFLSFASYRVLSFSASALFSFQFKMSHSTQHEADLTL